MKALIDLDILPYAYGGMTFEDGCIMPDSMIQGKVDAKIKKIMEESGATSWVGYLTDSDRNFRIDVATILPYKGNREGSSKPAKWKMIREYLQSKYPDQVTEVSGIEADDQLAIDQYDGIQQHLEGILKEDGVLWNCQPFTKEMIGTYESTIICSIDKDLMMVPGWHYNWNTDKRTLVSEIEGLRWFYKQLLTGDTCDNIKGLHGVGAKSKLVTSLDDMDEEQSMFLHVQEQYEKRFGSYADQFLLETGKLLWMLKDREVMWKFPPITIEEEDECLNF